MNHRDCRCELLAHNEIGQVATCLGCGQIRLTLPDITLRFDQHAFRALASLLGQAQQHLENNIEADAIMTWATATGNFH